MLPRRVTARPCAPANRRSDIPQKGACMKRLLLSIWADDSANDLPEYAVAAVVFTAIVVVMKTLNIHGSDLLADMGINMGGVAR